MNRLNFFLKSMKEDKNLDNYFKGMLISIKELSEKNQADALEEIKDFFQTYHAIDDFQIKCNVASYIYESIHYLLKCCKVLNPANSEDIISIMSRLDIKNNDNDDDEVKNRQIVESLSEFCHDIIPQINEILQNTPKHCSGPMPFSIYLGIQLAILILLIGIIYRDFDY